MRIGKKEREYRLSGNADYDLWLGRTLLQFGLIDPRFVGKGRMGVFRRRSLITISPLKDTWVFPLVSMRDEHSETLTILYPPKSNREIYYTGSIFEKAGTLKLGAVNDVPCKQVRVRYGSVSVVDALGERVVSPGEVAGIINNPAYRPISFRNVGSRNAGVHIASGVI